MLRNEQRFQRALQISFRIVSSTLLVSSALRDSSTVFLAMEQMKRKEIVSTLLLGLPVYSEDMSMDELDDKSFPDLKTIVPGDINFSASVTPLLPLISQRVGFVFSALPFRARIFAFRLFDILSCENTGCYGWTNQWCNKIRNNQRSQHVESPCCFAGWLGCLSYDFRSIV